MIITTITIPYNILAYSKNTYIQLTIDKSIF